MKKERIVMVHWEGPLEWDHCRTHLKNGHVLYALYGSHHQYGRDVLLYLGRSNDAGRRMESHGRWIKDEYDTMWVRFGSIGEFIDWADWDDGDRYPPADRPLVAEVEALLIHAHQPAYNVMNKGVLPDTRLRVFNTGKLGHLLPEVSSRYYVT